MQDAISPQPRFMLPFWIRLSIAGLMFLDAALYARKAFFQFEWVEWFCFGMYWLIAVSRQKGEPLGTYLRNPRAIASIVFLMAAMVGFGHSLFFK